jgi:hypothetical protein
MLIKTKGELMFDEFWMMYPRKVAKAAARKVWAKLTEEQQLLAAKAIDDHCQYWKAKETSLEFIPHASSWLNGERYLDEIIIEPKKEKIDKKWMFSNEGIEAKARELGVIGNGYDTYDTLKRKCMNKLGMSAL